MLTFTPCCVERTCKLGGIWRTSLRITQAKRDIKSICQATKFGAYAAVIGLHFASSGNLMAQTAPATFPNARISLGGTVLKVEAQNDGKVIIAGTFRSVNGVLRTNIARLNPNGTVDEAWDPAGSLGATSYSYTISAFATVGTNLFVAQRSADSFGIPSQARIYKLSLSGVVDPTWNPELRGDVSDMVVNGDRLFVCGGPFTLPQQTNNVPNTYWSLARVSLVGTGAVDNLVPTDITLGVVALATEGDNVYAGGRFKSFGGLSRTNLLKFSATSGVVDPIWNPDPNGSVIEVSLAGTNLYIGGLFTRVDGSNRTNIAKVTTLGAGHADPIWRSDVESSAFVYSLNAAGGSLYIGGQFQSVRGLSRTNLARVQADGAGLVDQAWSAQADGAVRDIQINGGAIFAGGQFTQVGGATALGITKFRQFDGGREESFVAHAEHQGTVRAIARQPDGKLVISGSFHMVGTSGRAGLARFNGDGTLDTRWKPNFANGAYSSVSGLAVQGNEIFVRGNFVTPIDNILRLGLVKLDAKKSDAPDPAWSPITNWPGGVSALAPIGTNLYVGGDFYEIGGQIRPYLAKLSGPGNGAADAAWDAKISWDPFTTPGFGLAANLTHLFVMHVPYFQFPPVLFDGTPSRGVNKLSGQSGALDPVWNTNAFVWPTSMALFGTNLFVTAFMGTLGGRTNVSLLKVSTEGIGLADPAWNPPIAGAEARILGLSGTNLYVSGIFTNPAGQLMTNVFRLHTEGAGELDTSWRFPSNAPAAVGTIQAFYPYGRDVYVGGDGFAYFPEADAPVMVKRSATNFVIWRNPNDGYEVTDFRITGMTGGALRQANGTTPINVGEFITTAQGEAGLIWLGGTNGTVTAVSSLNATTNGTGSAASTLNLGAAQPPVFRLGAEAYEGSEVTNILRVSVQKLGAGAANVTLTTEEGTALKYDYNTGLGDYEEKTVTLAFAASDTNKSVVITLNNDAEYVGDRTFWVYLTNAVGAQLAYPAKAAVTILEDDPFGSPGSVTTNSLPATLPQTYATGGLQVELLPPGVGQWRLAGEVAWRNSGVVVSNLAAGLHTVEFKALPDYYTLLPATALVVTGQVRQVSFSYTAKPPSQTGGALSVQLEPGLVGGWRLTSEIIAQTNGYHPSGDVVTNLVGGSYQIEFAPAPPGYVAPQSFTVQVPQYAWQSNVYAATYLPVISGGSLLQPAVLSWNEITNGSLPHLYNGQLATDAGLSSGVVVKERVVLTAAHALFNEATLDWTTETRWFFQKHAGDYVSAPQTPRGWYVFAGYSAQRSNDLASGGSAGISTPQSQQLDAAALYFIENYYSANRPGRGGYAGFLASDAGPYNEHLLGNANKFLAGYPLIPGEASNWGKLYASMPTNLVFESLNPQVFRTAALRSFPGNSGGPLYVQWTNGHYYPAAIYLGGTAQTRVRAIDGEVVDLINRAEASANAGGNYNGGGVITISPRYTSGGTALGYVLVELGPPEAVAAGGAWRVAGRVEEWTESTSTPIYLAAGGEFRIEFQPATGWELPVEELVGVEDPNAVVTVRPRYWLRPVVGYKLGEGLRLLGSAGVAYRIEYKDDLASSTWTTLTNITLPTTNALLIPGTQPSTTGQRFFRATR